MEIGGNRSIVRVVFVLAVLTLAGCGPAQPSAGDVLEDYLATVGEDALDGIRSRVAKGKFSLPDMGYEGEFTMTSVPPELGRMEVRMGTAVVASSGIKGEFAWEVNSMSGARILEGGEKRQSFRQFALDPVLAWRDSFENAVIQEWDPEAQQIKVLVRNAEGDQVIFFFDRATKLLTRFMIFLDGQRILSTIEDYRELDGIMQPYNVLTDVGGNVSIKFSYDSLEYNGDVPPETFEPPEQIQKLLEQ